MMKTRFNEKSFGLLKAVVLLGVLIFSPAIAAKDPEPPTDLLTPFGKTTFEQRREVCPGVTHINRKTDDPLNINILVVDLNQPGVSIKPCLSNDRAAGLETVRSMAVRKGAVAGVNGDYWGYHGVPLSLTVIDSEIIIAPQYRTAFGITRDGTPVIDRWTDGWNWDARVFAPDGESHDITMMNLDCNEGWLCLYTDKYGMKSRGDSVSPETELVCNMEHRVLEVRTDLPGVEIPSSGFVLTGRDGSGQWLSDHFRPGDFVRLNLKSARPWQDLKCAIGAGPRNLKDGKFFQDPLDDRPIGEGFTRDWKIGHYYRRHPRTALGASKDQTKVILVTVDGRQPEFSIGVYQKQMVDLLLEFGAYNGMDLDSGGSSTMVIDGQLVSHPSDHAKKDGTGGRERRVANSLQIFYDDPGQEKTRPGKVSKEQHKLNIQE